MCTTIEYYTATKFRPNCIFQYQTRRTSELQAILQQRRQKADDDEQRSALTDSAYHPSTVTSTGRSNVYYGDGNHGDGNHGNGAATGLAVYENRGQLGYEE